MKKNIFPTTLLLASLLMIPANGSAAEPVVVVAIKDFATIGRLLGQNAELIGLKDQKPLLPMLWGTIKGIENGKPAGVFYFFENGVPTSVSFFPITDLDKTGFLKLFPAGMIKKEDGGKYRFLPDLPAAGALLEQRGPYLVGFREGVAVPENFPTYIAGIDRQYDLYANVNFREIPPENRLSLAAGVGLASVSPVSSENAGMPGPAMISQLFLQYGLEGLDALSLGLRIDDKGDWQAKLIAQAASQSDYTPALKNSLKAKTRFAGFADPKEAISGLRISSLPLVGEMKKALTALIQTRTEGILAELKKVESNAERGALLEKLVLAIQDGLLGGLQQRTFDAVLLQSNQGVILGAFGLPEDHQIGGALKALAPELGSRAQIDYDTFEGYSLSSAEIPVEAVAFDERTSLLLEGGPLKIVLALKNDALCFAYGNAQNAESLLKARITESREPVPVPQPVFFHSLFEESAFLQKSGKSLSASENPMLVELLAEIAKDPEAKITVEGNYELDSAIFSIRIGNKVIRYSLLTTLEAANIPLPQVKIPER